MVPCLPYRVLTCGPLGVSRVSKGPSGLGFRVWGLGLPILRDSVTTLTGYGLFGSSGFGLGFRVSGFVWRSHELPKILCLVKPAPL